MSERLSYFQDISSFHTKFELQYEGSPRELPEDLALFRIGFMAEELAEYAQASGFVNVARALNDLHEHIINKSRWMVNRLEVRNVEVQFDSLIDLVYVALGTSYLHNFDFDEGWDRVHTANMKKVRVENVGDSKRKSTFDVVKPRGWLPPDLSDLVVSESAVAASRLMKP